jgi:hypothetical protein
VAEGAQAVTSVAASALPNVTQLCVNDCGRTANPQLNVCCRSCSADGSHSLGCEERSTLDALVRKAAAYDKLRSVALQLLAELRAAAGGTTGKYARELAAIDADVQRVA